MKEVVAMFKKRLSTEIRRQEKLEIAEKRYFMKGELSEKYIAKILYKWDDRKFGNEYLKKLEKN